ncbi:MAG: phosphatidylglycerophosphatase A, partial [Lentisphaerae bacterium]|nr:phosphatidylglycerophosphatase A [Lentisphaerota bacterium]
PICSVAEKHFNKKDDGRIVADEYLAFPISMIGLPLTPAMFLLAFITFRIFDVLKPFPACKLQMLKGGLGIVIDDVIACLYALALNHMIFRIFPKYFSA